MKKLFKDKEFFTTILTLVIPITLQNLISSSLNMVDNIMIGRLGENEIAAVGLVNQYFFIFMLCLSGINAGASIFMAQYWGRRDRNSIKKVLGLDLVLGTIASIAFAIIALFMPEYIIKLFTREAAIINLGVQYLRIISVTFMLTNITQAFSTTLRCTGAARPPMVASLIGVATNAFLNWVFIFGNLGSTAMGVAGAALATSLARLVEMIIVLNYSYSPQSVFRTRFKEFFNFNVDFIKSYFRTSYSVILNELVWALGMTTYSIIYAKIGIKEVASMQIATTINNMFMVLCIGLAAAASIMVGNKIGAGEEDIAIDYAKKLGVLAPIIGVLIGLALWISAPILTSAFKINEDTLSLTVTVLKTMAFFAPLRFFNVLMIVGIFRGGGDTTYSMLVQLGTIWCFAIPAGFIAAVYFKLSLPIVYFIVCMEELVKVGFEWSRLRSKKWIRNIIEDTEIVEVSA
ncbi:MATE family efflux transporter [Clostridium bovifaecis]|uniref:MATE family efflux transporter n=1 Tax=Clostridium bovifaecis TaxID=2184719 RepID=A0A6I6EZW9_9CLOT|nr:MATE family efflux transporter [Clostridium bovifaecis]